MSVCMHCKVSVCVHCEYAHAAMVSTGQPRASTEAHLRLEAHVQHAISLVQHQVVGLTQVDLACRHKVIQAPGRGDHNLHAAAQLAQLWAFGGTAVNAGVADAAEVPKLVGLLFDLQAG